MMEAELPFSTEAEQYLLSTCLVNDNAVEASLDLIEAGDFYFSDHGKLFGLMTEMHGDNRVVDLATMSAVWGDTDFLHHLIELPAISARTRDYAEQIRDLAIRRRMIQAGLHIVDVARGNTDANEVMDEAENAVVRARSAQRGGGPSLLADTLDGMEGTLGDHTPRYGLRTHIQSINDIIIGMDEGAFCIVAARPGGGKTCMALDIARHLSRDVHVLFFSVEMTKRELAERLVAAEATVGLTKIRTGTMDEREEGEVRRAIADLKAHALTVDDSSTTMYDVQRKVRRVAARGDLGLVIVDYIQLLNMGRGWKGDSKNLEVAAMSRALKLMAREYNIPVIGVSQLNRPQENYQSAKAKPKRPTLASLRDSGALEQDADQVWFLFRPDEQSHEVEFIVAKNRNGPTNTAIVHFWPQFVTFLEIGTGFSAKETEHHDPDERTEGRHEEPEPEEEELPF